MPRVRPKPEPDGPHAESALGFSCQLNCGAVREAVEVWAEPDAGLARAEDQRHAVVHVGDRRVGGGCDDGELTLLLHAREEEGARARHAEAMLPAHRFSGLLAGDGLDAVGLVERADGHEAAALGDGVCPHAAPPAAELVERGLDAGVVDGGAPALEREPPGELDRGEAAVGVHDVGGDLGAGVGAADGVELVAAGDVGAAPVLAGVESCCGLVICEGDHAGAHGVCLSLFHECSNPYRRAPFDRIKPTPQDPYAPTAAAALTRRGLHLNRTETDVLLMPTLNWMGKEKVVNHHRDVPYRVLERVPEKGVLDSRGSDCGNMIIHGDNLEALKALLPEYEGKVDCIYIDPPYNTGNEGWVYNDNVNDPRIRKWLGQVVGKEGEDFSRHDKWLCMM